MINTLKTLCALSGVSSFEDEVRDYIRQRGTPYATDLRADAMGNLIVLIWTKWVLSLSPSPRTDI